MTSSTPPPTRPTVSTSPVSTSPARPASTTRTARALAAAGVTALVAGVGGAALAPSASATTRLAYSCSSPELGAFTASAVLDTSAPGVVKAGRAGSLVVLARLSFPAQVVTTLTDAGYDTLSGSATTTLSVRGSTGATVSSVPVTARVPSADVEDARVHAVAKVRASAPTAPGRYTWDAADDLTVALALAGTRTVTSEQTSGVTDPETGEVTTSTEQVTTEEPVSGSTTLTCTRSSGSPVVDRMLVLTPPKALPKPHHPRDHR